MRLLLAGLFAATAALAQTALPPRFEVATIKPGGEIFAVQPQRMPGRIRWTTQLVNLIGSAYDLPINRIDVPHAGSVYSIEAVFDAAAPESRVRLMAQSLLADRFKMRAHEMITEQDGLGLYIEKSRLKIKESEQVEPRILPDGTPDPATRSYIYAGLPEPNVVEIVGTRVTMAQLAERLAISERKPIWDRTGVSGVYTFSFRFSPSASVEQKFDYPPLAAALRQNLGLELKADKGPVRELIVDHIEEPTDN